MLQTFWEAGSTTRRLPLKWKTSKWKQIGPWVISNNLSLINWLPLIGLAAVIMILKTRPSVILINQDSMIQMAWPGTLMLTSWFAMIAKESPSFKSTWSLSGSWPRAHSKRTRLWGLGWLQSAKVTLRDSCKFSGLKKVNSGVTNIQLRFR